MSKRKCFVHDGRTDLATGHIRSMARKNMEVHLELDGVEYEATCAMDKVVKSQQHQLKVGRYIAFIPGLKSARIHLCTCKWSKKELEEADKRANELFQKLQII